MCFLIVNKLVFLSGFLCVCVLYQLTTFAVLILYYFFYFVLCKRGKIKKLESPHPPKISLIGITSKDLLYSTGNSAQCHVAAWMGGEFGGEWIHVYVWLSRFAVHLKLSQHC